MLKIEPGKFYMDGNGAVHGPLKEHPTAPEMFLLAMGATYFRSTGAHVSTRQNPELSALNLVSRVTIRKAK